MKSASLLIVTLALTALNAAAEPDLTKLPPAAKQTGVTYDKEIKPLFEASCFRCHGPQRARAELRLDSLEAALKGSENGKVILPGDSQKSKLLIAAAHVDPEFVMPPRPRNAAANNAGSTNAPAAGQRQQQAPPKPLTTEEVALVRAWIEQGAK